MILNLGAGNRLVHGAVNHDRVKHRPEIDVAHDLNNMPWPWPDGSFDRIVAWSVLEHLQPTLVTSIDECWRLLERGGLLEIKLPRWDLETSWIDPTHYWKVTLATLDHFVPGTQRGDDYSFYTERKWMYVNPPSYVADSVAALMRKVT